MKAKITLLFLFVISMGYTQIASFTTKDGLGNNLNARNDAGMVSYNGELYILGGFDSCGPKNFTKYNPSTEVFTELSPLSNGCGNPLTNILFVVQNKIYHIGSAGTGVSIYDILTNKWEIRVVPTPIVPDSVFMVNGVVFMADQSGNTFYAFDTATNTFTQKANRPGEANIVGAISFDLNGKGYWGGGLVNNCYDGFGNCVRKDFYEYNPVNDTWVQKSNLPIGCQYGVGVGVNGKGYIGTGTVNLDGIVASQLWYSYDPINDNWSQIKNMISDSKTEGIASSSICKLGNDIFVFGGKNWQNIYYDDLYKYDTSLNSWNHTTEIGNNRAKASGFYSNGKVYILGGEDSERVYDFWEYDIATGVWQIKSVNEGQIDFLHSINKASVEVNGKGYFIGGQNPYVNTQFLSQWSDKLLEYDPTTNQWAVKAPFPGGNRAEMVALSYNGNLYAGLGTFESKKYSDFMRYNPTTNTWTALASAPLTADDYKNAGYFVLGDVAYVIVSPSMKVLKYSFDTNTWETQVTSGLSYGIANYTNLAFAYKGKAYCKNINNIAGGIQLSEFNPLTGIWSNVAYLPFGNQDETIISTPNGVYFGFGYSGFSDKLGIAVTNDWKLLDFDKAVSKAVGVYEPIVSSSNYPYYCGYIPANSSQVTYDVDGNLFSAIVAGSKDISGVCYEVNSIPLSEPFRKQTADFGNGTQEDGMFLNKSISFKIGSSSQPGYNQVQSEGKLKLYYTIDELNKLTTDFNQLYKTNKTIQDIKIVQYNYLSNDLNPLNNIESPYSIYNPIITDYGGDKIFEINSTGSKLIYGEIYAVLLTSQNLGTSTFENSKISIYPNPASTVLNIQLLDNKSIDNIIITDLSGKKIKQQKGNITKVNIENLAKGMYVLEVFSGEQKLVNKFIKE